MHLPSLFEEMQNAEAKGIVVQGRLWISDRAHLVFACHLAADAAAEVARGSKSIGTTLKVEFV